MRLPLSYTLSPCPPTPLNTLPCTSAMAPAAAALSIPPAPSSPATFSLSSYYHLIFTAIAFLVSTLIFLFSRVTKKSRRPTLPPSPPGWPLVGNLFQVARSGKPFFIYVRELMPRYGPIFTLRMGARTLIVVGSAALTHEALVQNGQTFASRPSDYPTRNIFSNNKFTVNSAVYGPIWRSLRRNLVQNALSSSKLQEFRRVRNAAMDRLVARLLAESETDGGAVWVIRNARFAFFCILLSICFGWEMDESTVERMDQMMMKVLITIKPRVDDYLPVLGIFFSKDRKRAVEVRREQIETLVPLIERRRSYLKNPASDPDAVPFSYLDTLFDLEVDGKKESLNHADIVSLASEFLNGGTDTTGTAVEWAVGRLIDNPTMQSRLYSEIRETVGGRKVEEGDLEEMPYLNAFVREVLRLNPPTPFLLTHAAIKATTLGGYDVPVGTDVEFYVPAISEDPGVWPEPLRFEPERYLTGGATVDITGVKGMTMLPFGAGRRICPGMNMATLHVKLMLARMVQAFEWSAYPKGSKVDFTPKYEFTVLMKTPLRATIKPRAYATPQ